MEPRVAVFEEELAQRRERYNTAYAMARRARPRLDGELFMHNLRRLVAPILANLEPQKARPLVEPLYDLCLELTGTDLFGRSPAVTEVWTRLLPQAASELTQEPQRLAAALTNAAYNMEREPTTHLDHWLDKMERCRPLCENAGQWLQAGQVAAWLYGMAHFRETAIPLGNRLPERLRAVLCTEWDKAARDPWHHARGLPEPRIVRRVGSFVGFGGRFRQPPWVAYAGDDRFIVEDGTESWVLSADAFGATLKAGSADLEDSARDDIIVRSTGTLTWAGQTVEFPELHPVRSSAASPHVLAATSDFSHHVYLILGPGV